MNQALGFHYSRFTAPTELSITDHGGALMSQPMPAANAWTEVKLGGIAVTSGQAKIGVTSSGGTVTVDDFVLVAE